MMLKRCLVFCLFIVLGFGVLAEASAAVWGPQLVVAPTAKTYTFTAAVPGSYKLQIYNGGLPKTKEYASSAIVDLNGVRVVDTSNFSQQVQYLEVPVTLKASNTLTVDIRGKTKTSGVTLVIGDDKTPPSIQATVAPAANAAGWHRQDVTVSFTCSDADSPIQSCTAPVTVTTEGAGRVVSGTATNAAGLSATTSVTLNIDKTAPVITVSSPVNGATTHNSTVTISGSAQDSNSIVFMGINGTQAGSGSAFSYELPLDPGLNTYTVTARDIAGNESSVTRQATRLMDSVPPTVSITTPVAGSIIAGLTRVTVTAADDMALDRVVLDVDGTIVGTDSMAPYEFDLNTAALADGAHQLTATAYDASGNQATDRIAVTTDNINDGPAITSTPPTSVIEEQAYSYDVEAQDINLNEVLTYSLTSAPAGMAINATTGLITWTPSRGAAGQKTITVRVTDHGGLTAEQTFVLTVLDANDPPSITSGPVTTASEDSPYSYSLTAADPDAGDTLTFSLDAAPVGMQIDAQSGAVTWTPANEQVGDNPVIVRVTDAAGLFATQSYSVTVSNVNDSPVIQSAPITAASEDAEYRYAIIASDVDAGDGLGYTLTLAPAGMTIDAQGVVLWTPTNAQVGSHGVTVKVMDSAGAFAIQNFVLTVANVNDAPSIASVAVTTAVEETAYSYDVDATDVDSGDALTYSLELAPTGMAIDPLTGLIAWTPADSQVGNQLVIVKATDTAGLFVVQSFTVGVQNVNDVPIIVSQAVELAAEDAAYRYEVLATDADGDALTYALVTAPTGMTIDATGVVAWSPDNSQVGTHAVAIRVEDPYGLGTTQSYALLVTNTNDAPTITSVPGTAATEGQQYRYIVKAADTDLADSFTFRLTSAPSGMSIDSIGVVTWTPSAQQVGAQNVVLSVSDAAGSTANQTFAITVTARNSAPVITSTPTASVTQGQVYRYDVEATDANPGDVLTYSLGRAPAGTTIDPVTGEIQWTVDPVYAGPVTAQGGACVVDRADSSIFKPSIKWTFPNAVIGAPVAGPLVDTNNDGRTDKQDSTMIGVLIDKNYKYRLAVLRGDTGELVWRNDDVSLWNISIGFADVDKDGHTELFGLSDIDGSIVAFNGQDGSVKWQTLIQWPSSPSSNKATSFSFADLDGDGLSEILFSGAVLNHDGTVRWQKTTSGVSMLAADLDLDGTYEVIFGDQILDRYGNLLYKLGETIYSHVGALAIAGLDDDPNPEIVYRYAGLTYVFEHDGRLKWKYTHANGSPFGSPPAVADLDGDGFPEISSQSHSSLDILSKDGLLESSRFARFYDSSAFTGTTAFDFLGDGSSEVIINDHSFIHILYGNSAIPLYEWAHPSYTQQEYAVVADIDNDGHAEMVVYGGSYWYAYEDSGDKWPATYSVWNQYHYYPGVINEDGSVPNRPISEWNFKSTFRSNPALTSAKKPDLTVDGVRIYGAEGQAVVHASIRNTGEAALEYATNVSVYAGRQVNLESLIGSGAIASLGAGQKSDIAIPVPNMQSSLHEVTVVVDPINNISECNDGNNGRLVPIVHAYVTDSTGLVDNQIFGITVERDNAAPAFISTPVTSVARSERYQYIVKIADADEGDRVSYRLVQSPSFMQINDQGVVNAFPQGGSEVEGAYPVTIEACDQSNACVQQQFTLTVTAERVNQAPLIVNPGKMYITVGQLFVFDVVASDPDGDNVFVDVESGPVGVEFDPIAKRIAWTAGQSDVGTRYIRLVAYDSYGSTGSTPLQVEVVDPIAQSNRAPQIHSWTSMKAYSNYLFEYEILASDADGDALTYQISDAPAGMVLDGTTIRWTPAIDQVGYKYISIKVTDEHGLYTSKTLSIAVENSGTSTVNRYPSITSTPSPVAVAGQLYQYVINATDPDGDAVQYKLYSRTSAGMAFDAPSRTLNWTPNEADIGVSHTYVLEVLDGRGGRAEQSVTLKAVSSNRPPVISSVAPAFAVTGQAYAYQMVASDPDGDQLAYALRSSTADGMSVGPDGVVTWTPNSVGVFTAEVEASDGRGGAYRQIFSVSSDTYERQLPVVSSLPVLTARAAENYQYRVLATDPRGEGLSYRLLSAPAGMTISASGMVDFHPVAADVGSHPISIQISNSLGSRLQDYLLTVLPENRAPVFQTVPVTTAIAGQAYSYSAAALDADGDAVSYSLVSGPTGLSINSAGLVAWTPTSAQLGQHTVVVRASDGRAYSDQTFTLTVNPDIVPLEVFITVTPSVIDLNASATVAVSTIGGTGSVTTALSIDGVAVALDANGQAVVTGAVIGGHALAATATDGTRTVSTSAFFSVRDPADAEAPVVAIIAPADESVITAPVQIIGSVSDANLVSYRLLVSPRGENQWSEIATGTTPVANGVLGSFDPSLLLNGLYDVALVAVDANGQQSTAVQTYQVEGNLKLGNFSVSFDDITLPLAGIPVTVTRTYDSRERARSLDFGYGWSIGYRSVRVQENMKAGRYWKINTYGGSFGQKCVQSNGDRIVSVALPDGRLERFRAKVSPECTAFVPTIDVSLVYEPIGDSGAKLEQLDYGMLRLSGEDIVDLSQPFEPVDPRYYRLTTAEGMVYEIEQGVGISRMVEPNGNAISFTASGIYHSSGVGVSFVRDAAGRITAIDTPDGQRLVYQYGAAGDLLAATDRAGNATRYSYLAGHYLEDILDPRGVQAVRNVYDASGRLIAQIGPDGERIELTHDLNARTEIVRDARGNATTYAFDERGNVLSETNAAGETTTHAYDAKDNETARTDALGHTTRWSYDARGNKLTETDPLGRVTTRAFNDRNQVLTETNTLGQVVSSSTYDDQGNITRLSDALGNATTINYDWYGNASRLNDATGIGAVYGHDSKGNKVYEIDGLGVRRDYAYDANGRVLTETTTRTDASGQIRTLVTRYEYDPNGNRTAVIDALGQISRTEYNALGKEAATIDALGRRTEYGYDTRGRKTLTRHPDGSTESVTFDANGNKTAETDRGGRTTSYEYDAANRLIRTVLPDGGILRKAYDAAGRLSEETDAAGGITRFEYDAAGQLVRETNAAGHATTYGYDEVGNRITQTDANGHITRFEYDAARRLTATVHPDGTRVTVQYDALGRKTAETDPNGRTTRYGYDATGRLTQVTDAANGITRYGYDEQGNKVSQTDALGRLTRWAYDDLGRVTSRTLPAGQTEHFTYDAVGNRLTHTDFNGATTAFEYDALSRETRRTYSDGSTVTTTYTASGQVDTVTDAAGTTDHDYDIMDRLERITYPNGQVIEYGYDSRGNRVTLTSGTHSVSYRYNPVNQLESVTDSLGETTYAYDGVGNLTRLSYPNGTTTDTSYDSQRRPLRITTRNGAGQLVSDLAYTLDAAGHRTGLSEASGRTTAWTYDALYRLTEEQVVDPASGARLTNWTYDAVGNRLTQTENGTTSYSYDANDRLQSETGPNGSISYRYDQNGNTTEKTQSGLITTYRYNAANRLTEVITPTDVLGYRYDASGIRNSRTRNGQTTDYLVDPNRDYAQVIGEYQGGVEQASYTYGDRLIRQGRGLDSRYYHADALGSTRALTDASGNPTDSYAYKAFGETEVQTGSTANGHLFTGEQYDAAAGLYYLRARWMEAKDGRFISQDSFQGRLAQPASLHKYLYAENDPVGKTDPSGLMTLGELSAGLNIQSRLLFTAGNIGVRKAFAKFGCELGISIADEAITYGIYVLFDGASFYVGQSNDIDRRYREHLDEAKKDVTKAWKSKMQIVARFTTDGGKDAMRIMEQYVMDALDLSDNELKNVVQAINKKRGRLRTQYRDFLMKVCK